MIPESMLHIFLVASAPRSRGDDPNQQRAAEVIYGCSPLTRG